MKTIGYGINEQYLELEMEEIIAMKEDFEVFIMADTIQSKIEGISDEDALKYARTVYAYMKRNKVDEYEAVDEFYQRIKSKVEAKSDDD